MILGTASAWISWAVILHAVDPTRAGIFGIILFYATLTVALFGSFSLFGILIRFWQLQRDLPSRVVGRSFRQAILLTFLILGSMLLLSQEWFRWWTMLLLIIVVSLTELLFLSSRKL